MDFNIITAILSHFLFKNYKPITLFNCSGTTGNSEKIFKQLKHDKVHNILAVKQKRYVITKNCFR